MFEQETFPHGRRVRFSASLPLLDRAVAATVDFLKERQATGSLFDVKLVLREALLNAVLHGSRSDPRRQVKLEAMVFADRLDLCVTDQGQGFSWRESLADPPSPEATSGRGLTIMALYADAVRFNEVGNQVRLIKCIPGLLGPAVPEDQPGEANSFRRETMNDFRVENGHTIHCPSGDIVASVAEDLRARLRELMREHPGPLVMDLSRVELIDSVGIGLLIATHNSLAKSGHRLALENVNADLAGLLRTMRLDKHFSIEIA
jgi:anti-anti-sigma factor